MNRPKKNKVHNPTLPDDQQVDERNLIDLEESSDISIEDRIHLYWVENKAFISGCITILALFIIGINGMRIYKQHAEEKIQAAYAEAMANDSLESFAREYSNKDLGGFAALDVADEYYRAEDYEQAIEFYGLAAETLDNDLLAARARLGRAFATFYGGDESSGLDQLSAIASDNGMPGAIRNEAAYHLAINADVAGDTEAYEAFAAQVNASAGADPWQQRMQLYEQQR